MRKYLVLAATAALLVTGVAVLLNSASAGGDTRANASVRFACPTFTVVVPDPEAGFGRGTYRRRNFSEPKEAFTCDDAYHVLRSYLYHPSSHRGWSVSRLKGDLSNKEGKRFVKNGTDSQIGFDVFRP